MLITAMRSLQSHLKISISSAAQHEMTSHLIPQICFKMETSTLE